MKTGVRRHLTPGNAVALAALVVALGGTAVAQVAIPNGSVTTPKLKNGSVTTAKIANSGVKSADIANGAVDPKKISKGAVTSAKIAKGAVTSAKIKAATITAANIAPGVLGGVSPSKLAVVKGDPLTVPSNATRTASVTCPAGQRAISGGFNAGVDGVVLAAGPTTDGTGWLVTVASSRNELSIFATAVCVAS
jgi:hypothetical protein